MGGLDTRPLKTDYEIELLRGAGLFLGEDETTRGIVQIRLPRAANNQRMVVEVHDIRVARVVEGHHGRDIETSSSDSDHEDGPDAGQNRANPRPQPPNNPHNLRPRPGRNLGRGRDGRRGRVGGRRACPLKWAFLTEAEGTDEAKSEHGSVFIDFFCFD